MINLVKISSNRLLISTDKVALTQIEINKVAKRIPMKRMGKPEDVANACIFFASALADWITGAALEVHGGGEKPSYLEVAKPKK